MSNVIKKKPAGYLKSVGLKNIHSYTLVDVREITLDSGDIEYLLFLRNPTGNIFLKKEEVWNGDWSPMSPLWTPRTRKQLNYHVTENDIKRARNQMKEAKEAFKRGEVDNQKIEKAIRKSQHEGGEAEEEEEEKSLMEFEGGDKNFKTPKFPGDDDIEERKKRIDKINKLMVKKEDEHNDGFKKKMNARLKGKDGEQYQLHDYSESNAKGSTFWMSLKDFVNHFYISTIAYSDKNH